MRFESNIAKFKRKPRVGDIIILKDDESPKMMISEGGAIVLLDLSTGKKSHIVICWNKVEDFITETGSELIYNEDTKLVKLK